MSTFVSPPLDFSVVREDWCRYDLADSAILKVKVILTMIHKEGAKHTAEFYPLSVILTNERGEPHMGKYTPQELQESIIRDEVRYTTVSQDWNEYVADDGTRVKIQPIVMRVAKTSKFNNKGAPIYLVNTQATIQVKSPNRSPDQLPAPDS